MLCKKNCFYFPFFFFNGNIQCEKSVNKRNRIQRMEKQCIHSIHIWIALDYVYFWCCFDSLEAQTFHTHLFRESNRRHLIYALKSGVWKYALIIYGFTLSLLRSGLALTHCIYYIYIIYLTATCLRETITRELPKFERDH